MIITQPTIAEEVAYRKDLSYKYYNNVWKQQYDKQIILNVDPKSKEITMYIQETLGISGILLTNKTRLSLIKVINKFNKWNAKAIKMKVKLEKEIATIKPDAYYYKSGDNWTFFKSRPFSIVFFSQSKSKHQMVFKFESVTDYSSDYNTHKINTMYFTHTQANELNEALQNWAIKSFLKNRKKKKKIEDQFK